MKNKLCKFTDEEWNEIEQVQNEHHLKNAAAALRYLINDYHEIKVEQKKHESIANLIFEKMLDGFKGEILGILHSSRAAEKNTAILIDTMNTMLFRNDIKGVILTEEVKSPVIKAAEASYRKKIANKKQKKDFMNKRSLKQ